MAYYAILVTIDHYASDEIGRLQFAHRDGAVLAGLLIARGYKILHLSGQDATRERILDVLSGNVASIGWPALAPDDVFLFFFAGHGELVGGQYVLHAYHAHPGASIHSVAIRDIAHQLKTVVPCQHCACIIDACRNLAKRGARGGAGLEAESTRDIKAVSSTLDDNKLVEILYGCDEGQISMEDPSLQHGVLTYHVAQVIEENTCSTMEEVFDEAADRMRSWWRQTRPGESQEPQLYRPGGRRRIVLFPNVAGDTDDTGVSPERPERAEAEKVVRELARQFVDRHATWKHAEWMGFLAEVRKQVLAGVISDADVNIALETEAAAQRKRRADLERQRDKTEHMASLRLPPLPQEILAVEDHVANLCGLIAQIEQGRHPDVAPHHRALERLLSQGKPVITLLREAIEVDPLRTPSDLCQLAPTAPLEPMLALIIAYKKLVQLRKDLTEANQRLRRRQEEDFRSIVHLHLIECGSEQFPIDVWMRIQRELAARRYEFASDGRKLLKAAEREFAAARAEPVERGKASLQKRRRFTKIALISTAVTLIFGVVGAIVGYGSGAGWRCPYVDGISHHLVLAFFLALIPGLILAVCLTMIIDLAPGRAATRLLFVVMLFLVPSLMTILALAMPVDGPVASSAILVAIVPGLILASLFMKIIHSKLREKPEDMVFIQWWVSASLVFSLWWICISLLTTLLVVLALPAGFFIALPTSPLRGAVVIGLIYAGIGLPLGMRVAFLHRGGSLATVLRLHRILDWRDSRAA